MIALKKSECPPVLKKNKEKWKKAILDALALGQELTTTQKTRYSHKDIKTALVEETSSKCSYCESKVKHISFGDIEHIAPKSLNPELWVEWNNLTLACQICNNSKRDFDVTPDTFVDPYVCDPEDRFHWAGTIVWGNAGDDAARITEEELKLNRPDLVERRKERLEVLRRHAEVIQRTADPKIREVFLKDFEREFEKDKEYVACARAYKKLLGFNPV